MSNNSDQYSDYEDDRPSLAMNERIVWISDNGPEYGNVRWLGKLPDLGKEWMAGVEFDHPVGSGTGLYKDRQLFTTKLNHASLVPVIGLLKASDFDGPPNPPERTSSVSLIDFINNQSEISPKPTTRVDDHKPYSNNKSHTDDLYSEIHDRIERHSKNIISAQASRAPTASRIHHIPIRFERYEDKSDNGSSSLLATANASKRPELPSKPISGVSSKDGRSSNKSSIQNLITSLEKSSINERRAAPEGVSLLPAPPFIVAANDKNPASSLKNLLGKSRGIQGHNNSCYLDATLFAMYSSTTLFDSLLYRPPNHNDIREYSEIQRILREDIVRQLREDYIVSADQVMLFRTMLEQSSSVAGLTDQEKDPEEFLNLLLGQILKADPYLKFSSGLESFFYQLFPDKDENVVLPTVQDLFEQSFVGGTVRLREIPPCLLLQTPRHGAQFKMYSRIMPSLKLDITDVLEAAPRACGHRGKDCDNIARFECKDCLQERSGRTGVRLSSITYCSNCFHNKHFGKSHITGIEDHDKTKTPLNLVSNEAISRYSNKIASQKDREIPRICMDLFAVLCIETSHYVCFVKCGQEPDSPWCFFDSMADRRGEQNGYNIPEILLFDEFAFWTSDGGVSYLLSHKDDKLLPDMARRLICDAYLCFYQYNGLTTYR